MLVLSRLWKDSIVCCLPPGYVIPPQGLEIRVMVCGPKRGRVQIGIDAPQIVSLERDDYIPDEKESA